MSIVKMKFIVAIFCFSMGAAEIKELKQEKRNLSRGEREAYEQGGRHHAAMAIHAARQRARQAGIWCSIL